MPPRPRSLQTTNRVDATARTPNASNCTANASHPVDIVWLVCAHAPTAGTIRFVLIPTSMRPSQGSGARGSARCRRRSRFRTRLSCFSTKSYIRVRECLHRTRVCHLLLQVQALQRLPVQEELLFEEVLRMFPSRRFLHRTLSMRGMVQAMSLPMEYDLACRIVRTLTATRTSRKHATNSRHVRPATRKAAAEGEKYVVAQLFIVWSESDAIIVPCAAPQRRSAPRVETDRPRRTAACNHVVRSLDDHSIRTAVTHMLRSAAQLPSGERVLKPDYPSATDVRVLCRHSPGDIHTRTHTHTCTYTHTHIALDLAIQIPTRCIRCTHTDALRHSFLTPSPAL